MTTTFPAAGRMAQALALAALASFASQAGAVEYWLRAEPLTVSMPPGTAVPMWGYASCTDASFTTCDAPTVPGPALTVPVGDPLLTVHLKNALPSSVLLNNSTSIVIPGQSATMVPVMFTDSSGRQRVRSFTHETLVGGVGDYSWTNMRPGTYLYHSGTHPQVQVQMGLYGGVTKDAAAGQAYAGVPFSHQVTLLYSEIDPALHAAVAADSYDPAVNSTLAYQPRYFLINGKPFQAGDPPLSTLPAGQPTLLRFLNAGLQTRVPVINGTTLRLVAEDGNPYPWPANPREQFSVLLPAAKTIDALVVAPVGAVGSTDRFAIFDRRMGLSNDGAANGGMFAVLAVGGGANAPVITSTAVTVATQGAAYSYDVDATDADAGDVLAYSLDVKPAGMIIDTATGLISWTPGSAQTGAQSVRARVVDSTGLFATQSFSITVANVNDPPVAQNDGYTMVQGSTLTVAAPGVLGNDTDPDPGDTLTAVNFSAPSGGTLTAGAGGDFSFTAAATGVYTFTYQARDASGADSNVATVSISVNANRAPVAVNDVFTAPVLRPTIPYVAQVLTVLANDSDPDTALDPTNVIAPSTVVISTPPNKGGTVTVNANGTISYTPRQNFKGSETFAYRVRDNLNALSNAATVRVDMN